MYDFVFAGLGNPGEKYSKTKHNIGWMVIESLAKDLNLSFSAGKSDYYYSNFSHKNKNILIVLPTTYMNNSGLALRHISDFFKVHPSKFAILVDEYNFPIGKIHIKNTGSDGGHNGTNSVINHLNTKDFIRIRLGIDKKFGPGELVNYVLGDFDKEDESKVTEMINNTKKALFHLIENNFNKAISEINSGKIFVE